MAEIRFSADAALDCWRFGQQGEGFPLHHWANYELHSPTVATLVHDSGRLGQLVLRIAHENPTWGYDRIQGAVANLGHDVSDQTVGNILKRHGIEPAPDRKRQTTWKTFINKSHWDVLGAIDFTTIEVWTAVLVQRVYMTYLGGPIGRCHHPIGL